MAESFSARGEILAASPHLQRPFMVIVCCQDAGLQTTGAYKDTYTAGIGVVGLRAITYCCATAGVAGYQNAGGSLCTCKAEVDYAV